ncbi:hypothetical protein P8936_09390 [Edaphobacter paludis]|uniref:Uncharacterized protein n=1 Tax=Edaphobacter paludis TaxID=3035702 RepID=A0AAU7D4A2_9BACT
MPGRTVVQWDKEDRADLGIIKVDLLSKQRCMFQGCRLFGFHCISVNNPTTLVIACGLIMA